MKLNPDTRYTRRLKNDGLVSKTYTCIYILRLVHSRIDIVAFVTTLYKKQKTIIIIIMIVSLAILYCTKIVEYFFFF